MVGTYYDILIDFIISVNYVRNQLSVIDLNKKTYLKLDKFFGNFYAPGVGFETKLSCFNLSTKVKEK